MIRVELVEAGPAARAAGSSIVLLCRLPVLVAVFVAVTHVAPPPGQGPALLSAVLSNGSLYPAAALAIVLPIFLPVAVRWWRATRSPARPARACCGTCWPGRWAGPGSWSPS